MNLQLLGPAMISGSLGKIVPHTSFQSMFLQLILISYQWDIKSSPLTDSGR